MFHHQVIENDYIPSEYFDTDRRSKQNGWFAINIVYFCFVLRSVENFEKDICTQLDEQYKQTWTIFDKKEEVRWVESKVSEDNQAYQNCMMLLHLVFKYFLDLKSCTLEMN